MNSVPDPQLAWISSLPSCHHARVIPGFPIAVALRSLISTALLSLTGRLGLRGWMTVELLSPGPALQVVDDARAMALTA
ncbi:hypothetical protein [Rhodopila sp.]|uniref:hypothetical protein n=1 Tax=Rhodopila sp. TaxID=2480087 RepID=UPI003D10A545